MTSLDGTFSTMSSSNFDSAAVLGQGLISVKRSLGQQFSKPVILDLPLGTPPRSADSFNSGASNVSQSVEQTSGGQSAPQPSSLPSATGGDGGSGSHERSGSGGQPPGGSGNHSSGSSLSTQEKTSGESTTTTTSASGGTQSGSSMPELVDPPPDPSSMSLLFPAADTPCQEESSKRVVGEADAIAAQRSDESQVSEATTAVVSDTDSHGRSLSRHYGLHVVNVNHPSGSGPKGAATSTSSSSPVKGPDALDTTASTLSPFTTTSADKSKSSDSSDQLDASQETLDLFESEKEFAVSTPTPTASIAGRTANLELSEFLIPPSAKCDDSLSLDDQSSSFTSSVWEHDVLGGQSDTPVRSEGIKRPYSVDTASKEPEQKRKQPELHLELPSTSDVQLIQPSRRAAVDMAVKATRGEFLMKSIGKTDENPEGVAPVSKNNPSNAGSGGGDTAAPSDPPAEVEPSAKAMRQIVFDSLTSSDEASAPSTSLATKGTPSSQSLANIAGAGDASRSQEKQTSPSALMLPPESASEKEDATPETNRVRLLIASQETPTSGPDRAVEDIVEDTEEDEDLILRYCPSRTSQSQYYPLVPETDVSATDQESQDDGHMPPSVAGRRVSKERDSRKSDSPMDEGAVPPPTSVPTFHLRRPSPVASDDDDDDDDAKSAGGGDHDDDDDSSSDEKNPFDTANFFAEPSGKSDEASSAKSKGDETDVPGGPVGRHKRKNIWGEEGDLSDTTRAYITKKHPKLAARSFGCQVGLDDFGEASVKDGGGGGGGGNDDDDEQTKAESKAVQTVLSGDIKAAEESRRSEVDGAEKSNRRRDFLRRTVVVRRTITEELFRRGKMVSRNIVEEEDDAVVTELTGREAVESAVFARPTPLDKQSPSGSSSSKSASTNVSLNKSASSSSLTSGALGDVSSSLSKSSPSPKQTSSDFTSSDEQPVTSPTRKPGGETRALRSVRRRKANDARKNLAVQSEGDSTPETKAVETPTRKQGRPRSKDSAGTKRRGDGDGNGDGDEASTSTTKTVAEQDKPATPDVQIISEGMEASSSRKQKSQPSSARVMARWRDGCYYPGLILDREKDDRVRVEYDDGKISSVKGRDVLAVAVLPVGQCVLSMSADGLYDSSLVVDHYEDSESGDVGYVVEIDGGTAALRVTRSRVILTAEQAAILEANAGTPPVTRPGTANISLDNLVEGKRRCAPQALSTPTTPVPRTRRAARKLDETGKRKRASKTAAEESPSSDS